MCARQHDGRHLGQPAQFFGPLQGYQPTLSPPPSRTLRVPAQLWTLALASDLRSSLAMHLLDHGRLLAADDPSTSPYASNALLPMSVALLAGSLLKAIAAVCAPQAMGAWDCRPARSAGRLANYLDLHAWHFAALALEG